MSWRSSIGAIWLNSSQTWNRNFLGTASQCLKLNNTSSVAHLRRMLWSFSFYCPRRKKSVLNRELKLKWFTKKFTSSDVFAEKAKMALVNKLNCTPVLQRNSFTSLGRSNRAATIVKCCPDQNWKVQEVHRIRLVNQSNYSKASEAVMTGFQFILVKNFKVPALEF